MISGCPGSAGIKGTPTLKIKICPECDGEIELFSTDAHAICMNCGFMAYNDEQSCIRWCTKACECVGEEIYTVLSG